MRDSIAEKTQISALYVCPRAHCPGHYSDRTKVEIASLVKAGVDVTLITFQGLIDGVTPEDVKHYKVIQPNSLPARVLAFLEKFGIARFFVNYIYQFVTVLISAITYNRRPVEAGRNKFDVIHLLNGDPYIHIPFLLGVFFRDINWIITMLGTTFALKGKTSYAFPILMDVFRRLQNLRVWSPIYRYAMKRNNYVFIGHDLPSVAAWKGFLTQGMFEDKTFVIPWGYEMVDEGISVDTARAHLKLPKDKKTFLVFGLCHHGKDMETVILALKEIPGIVVVQAGFVPPEIHERLKPLIREAGVEDRYIIRNGWISEGDKKNYFNASDAVILSYKKGWIEWPSIIWSAASYKRPIIVGHNNAVRDYVTGYQIGFVFNPSDAASLKDAIVSFLKKDNGDIEKMQHNCMALIKDISPDSASQRWISIYRGMPKNQRTLSLQ